MNTISGSPNILRNADVGEMLRLLQRIADLELAIREHKAANTHPFPTKAERSLWGALKP